MLGAPYGDRCAISSASAISTRHPTGDAKKNALQTLQ
jgi:hypothetical protein